MPIAALEGAARTAKDSVCGEGRQALAGTEELEAAGAFEARAEAIKAGFDGVLRGGDEFGGGGWRGRAEVGGCIGDG